MFRSKLVCDKCGTEASTGDKFCRECSEKGTPKSSKFFDDKVSDKPSIQEMIDKFKTPTVETRRCKTCGKVVTNYGHECIGLFGPTDGNALHIRWHGSTGK